MPCRCPSTLEVGPIFRQRVSHRASTFGPEWAWRPIRERAPKLDPGPIQLGFLISLAPVSDCAGPRGYVVAVHFDGVQTELEVPNHRLDGSEIRGPAPLADAKALG